MLQIAARVPNLAVYFQLANAIHNKRLALIAANPLDEFCYAISGSLHVKENESELDILPR